MYYLLRFCFVFIFRSHRRPGSSFWRSHLAIMQVSTMDLTVLSRPTLQPNDGLIMANRQHWYTETSFKQLWMDAGIFLVDLFNVFALTYWHSQWSADGCTSSLFFELIQNSILWWDHTGCDAKLVPNGVVGHITWEKTGELCLTILTWSTFNLC